MILEALSRFAPHVLAGAACAGIAAANVARLPRPAPAMLAAAIAAGAVFARGHTRLAAFAAALVLAGWWWGSVRLEALDRSTLIAHVGEVRRVQAVVTGPVRRSRFALRLPATVRRFGDLGLREPVLLELPLGRAPPQGAIAETIATVRLPREADGDFDERAYLRRRGVHVVLKGGSWRLVGRRGGLGGVADRLRSGLAKRLAPGQEGERRAVLAGVVLGEDEGLSEELRDSFRASGLYHLLAVSGQNVALVAAGMLLVAWLLGLPRWLGELGALAGIGAYVLAVGWQPSVVRAGVAGALASLAWLAARPRDRWYFMLAGGATLLAWNPYSLLEPGFQLSFTAVAAIFVAVPWFERKLEGYPLPRWLIAVAAVSTACGLVTAPILWLHFGAIPLLSVPANALAAPAMPLLLALAFASAGAEPLLPDLAFALGWLNGWLAAYLAACARLVGGVPYAQATSLRAVGALVAAAGFVVLLLRVRRPRGRAALALVATALAVGVAWHIRPVAPPPAAPTHLRITFLDVGQGDAVLLQVREGAVLVDQGPPEGKAATQLRRLGIRRLSALVLTHPQRDHVGGAADVLRWIPVDFVLDPGINSPSPEERQALAEARRRRVPVVLARAGRTYSLGRLRLRILWPTGPGPPGDDPNNWATVLHASYGETDVLLTADAESNVTLPLPPPQAEILKVAHHGSADPGLGRLLQQVKPRVAVVSVGRYNDYGHPTASTLATLEGFPELDLYRTDRDGRVVIESDGERITVAGER